MLIENYTFSLRTERREQFLPITDEVINYVRKSGVKIGSCKVFIPHTTAGVTINENADPDVLKDVLMVLNELVPQNRRFLHSEGNSDAHVKSTLVGVHAEIPIQNGQLQLGQWQSIFFTEFDGPRTRRVIVVISGEK
jgi:secondary thiamine-phosphate synthase enzyme